MNEKLRQSIIGLIWPGPVAGPLPVNLFRILSIFLVLYLSAFAATLVMAALTGAISIFYFRLLELTAGKEWVEDLLQRLPTKTHTRIETKGQSTLFLSGLLIGVFPYAIFLRLLRYPEAPSVLLLILSSTISSFIWTGVVWGSLLEGLKQGVNFAF
ncbi:MAG: hypothetical protein A2Z24_01280 [Candidatus Woykebacteria bacterium RBG_16_44_10]|uniref:Uncharacterized protein n=1 Tax=Candidatus Woykebacteria bacterium RBG_16_44_10 TaxID=1802597 RepID=A0A1G1WDK1_9BACT|nr:MAG: hypothetical protein A2Z24_01280 [Candidatus Woykebacteria bacterium RBG_16_44_10]